MKNLKFVAALILLALPGVVCAQTSKSGRTTRGTLASRPACPSVASAGDIYEATDQNPLLTTVCDAINGWISLGGGASPAGNNGDLQDKNGAALGASGENDNGTILSVARDLQTAGPVPWYDIRTCVAGAMYCGSITGSSTTGTITGGTNSLSLASAQNFTNGQGIVVYQAGASPTITTPAGTPTVTPNVTTGATTWNYKIIAEDYKGGLTAASAAGTTSTGAATLGSFTISGATGVISNGVLTITTGAAHGLNTGARIQLSGGAVTQEATVATVPSGTTFTVKVGTAQNNASISGITITALACNTITLGAGNFSGTGTLRYWLYRSQGAGSYAIQGVAMGLDPYFVDCGGSAATPPSYVPATPPGGSQPGYLATTITAGGGTTSLTLAANAGTTATGQTVLNDNSSALLAAMTAAATGPVGGTVLIPGPNLGGVGFWNFSASTNMNTVTGASSNAIRIVVDGYIGLNQPWILRGAMVIEGTTKRTSSFMDTPGANIAGNSYPQFYVKASSGITLKNLFFNCNGPQCTDFYTDTNGSGGGSTGIIAEKVDFGNNANNGTSHNVIIKGGFDYIFRQVTCDSGSGTNPLPVACLYFTDSSAATESGSQMAGRVRMSDMFFDGAGISVDATPNSNYGDVGGFHIDGVLYESMQAAPFRLISSQSAVDFTFRDVIIADTSGGIGPVLDATGSSNVQNLEFEGGLIGTGNWPLYIGPATANIVCTGCPTNNLGNSAYFRSATGMLNPAQITEIKDHTANGRGTGRFGYAMAQPGAPTGLVLSSGGSISVGNHVYTVVAVDYDGLETILGPSATINVTTGNQTVTGTFPAAVSGQAGWNVYRDSFRILISGSNCNNSPQVTIAVTTFTDNGSGCGQSNPNETAASSSFISQNGLAGYQLRLNGNLFTGVQGNGAKAQASTGATTANDCVKYDANGNTVDAGLPCSSGGFSNPMTTLGDMIYENATPAPARLAGPTTPNGVPQTLTSTPSGGVAQAPVFSPAGVSNRDVTGTTSTDTILSTDCNNLVNHKESVANTVTLPTATTLGVPACVFSVSNNTTGTNTLVTIVPTTWTITPPGGTATTQYQIQPGQTVRVSVDGATNWKVDSAGAVASILNNGAWYLSPNCGGAPNCTTINANAHSIADATSNSTTTVTCPNSDCNFTSLDLLGRPVMQVGQKFWATTNGGFTPGISTTVVCPTTTVASFSANSVVLNAACTASGTANVIIYWGNDDGATLNAVMGKNCVAYSGPSGLVVMTSQGFGNTLPACASGGIVNSTGNPVPGWVHPNSATVYVMTPDFNWATCGASNCFGGAFGEMNNAVIWGAGLTSAANANCANGNNKVVLGGSSKGFVMRNVDIAGICPGAPGMVGILLDQPDAYLINGGAQDVGSIACKATSAVFSLDNDCHNADVVGNTGTVNGLLVASGANLVDQSSTAMSQVDIVGTLNSRGSHFVKGGQASGNNAVQVESGGIWLTYGDSDNVDPFIGQAGVGVQVNTGGQVQSMNTRHGASSSAGAAVYLPGGKFISLGGNTWSTGIPSINGATPGVYSGTGVLTGTCQGTATSSATLGLYGAGQTATPLCTSTTVNAGYIVNNVPLSGSAAQLFVIAGTGCKSGNTCVFTVMKTHLGTTSATTITCSMTGGAASCQDATHTDTPVLGDVYSIQFTTGTTETLANVTATLLIW